MERSFWGSMMLSPPLYGADTPVSFFDPKLPYGWNLRDLGDLLRTKDVPHIPGRLSSFSALHPLAKTLPTCTWRRVTSPDCIIEALLLPLRRCHHPHDLFRDVEILLRLAQGGRRPALNQLPSLVRRRVVDVELSLFWATVSLYHSITPRDPFASSG